MLQVLTTSTSSLLPDSVTRHEASLYDFHAAIRDVQNGRPLEDAVKQLLSSLTAEERLWILDGDEKFYEGLRTMFFERYNIRPFVMGAIERLKIPGIRFSDGPRGVCIANSTAFPISTARAATFDVDLEHRVGDAIGKEAKAQGANYYAGVCINLPRHPAWGRSQETYGDDPLVLGAFGEALTRGVQQHIMACTKHFALNSMENARFRVDVKIDDAALHEVYLPHFKRVVDAGVASVMSAYNSVNGEWAGQSKALLTDILRDMWNFDGFVMSDFIFGLRDPLLSLKNGLDLEAPFRQQRADSLQQSIENDDASWKFVDESCSRVLRKQLQFHISTAQSQPTKSVVFCQQHRALAREVAARSVVLLKNQAPNQGKDKPLLPLEAANLSSIAIIGRLANADNTGDMGSSRVISPSVVTLAEGLRSALPHIKILVDDSDDVTRASEVAKQVDLVICIAGYSAHDEGEYVIPSLQHDPELFDLLPVPHGSAEEEVAARLQGISTAGSQEGLKAGAGGDRRSLRLRQQDEAIVSAVVEANPRTVLSVICAGPVIMHELIARVPVAMISWYAGSEGGHGLTDVLLGKVDASGRLPFSIPRSEEHLPHFDIDAREIVYDRWHGQRLLDKLGVEAAFPFGFGLSYTSFRIENMKVVKKTDSELLIDVSVRNEGPRNGRFVAQAYARPHVEDFPSCVLVGFRSVEIEAGQTARTTITALTQPMSQWVDGKFVLPKGVVGIEVGAFAGDQFAVSAPLHL